MKSLIAILLVGYGSWSYIDLQSKNGFYSIVTPIIFFSLLAFCFWLVLVGGLSGKANDRTHFGSGSGNDFGGDGGD